MTINHFITAYFDLVEKSPTENSYHFAERNVIPDASLFCFFFLEKIRKSFQTTLPPRAIRAKFSNRNSHCHIIISVIYYHQLFIPYISYHWRIIYQNKSYRMNMIF